MPSRRKYDICTTGCWLRLTVLLASDRWLEGGFPVEPRAQAPDGQFLDAMPGRACEW
jgi:hypothetical protein